MTSDRKWKYSEITSFNRVFEFDGPRIANLNEEKSYRIRL